MYNSVTHDDLWSKIGYTMQYICTMIYPGIWQCSLKGFLGLISFESCEVWLSSARLLWNWGKNGLSCIQISYNKIQKGK